MSKKPPIPTSNAGSSTLLHAPSILRKKNNNNKKRPHPHASVSFQKTTDASSSSSSTLRRRPVDNNKSASAIIPPTPDDVSYDSDDLYDSVAYSGGGTMGVSASSSSSTTTNRGNDDDDSDDNDDDISSKMTALKKKRLQKLNDDVPSSSSDDNDDDNADPDAFRGEETVTSRDLSLKLENDLEYPVEAFNMNEERESGEGYFDGDTYIFRKERLEDDAWVKSLNDDEEDDDARRLSSSSSGNDMTFVARRTKKTAPVRNEEEGRETEEIYGELAGLMADGETVVMTLRRYGNVMKRGKITTKKESPSQPASSPSDDAAISVAKASLAKVTDLVDALFNKGDLTVYDRKRSELMERASSIFADADDEGGGIGGGSAKGSSSMPQKRNYFETTTTHDDDDDENKRQKISNDDNDNTSKRQQQDQYEWEYRGNEDHQIHGPFTTQQMLDWTTAGYFVNDQAVDIRRRRINENGHSDTTVTAGSSHADERKMDADDLMKDLLDDDDDDDENDDGDKGDGKTQEKGEWLRSDTVDFASFL